jgi:hypothetical protein
MDYTIFIKNRFLNTSIGEFSQTFDKTDYKGFERIVTRNTVLGMGKIALKICRKNVKSVFDKVDGIPLNNDNSTITTIREDGYVDRDEMYQLIKNSYQEVTGQKITKTQISKLTIREAIDLIIDYWNNRKRA